MKAGIIDKITTLAKRRKLDDLTIGPILSWDNKRIQHHVDSIMKIHGAKLLFGGKPLSVPHKIPEIYGSYEPTAIQVDLP